MKDNFEEFVKKNREKFDLHEPEPGLWKKINPEKRNPRFNRKKIIRTMSRVAAALLIFILSYAYHEFRDLKKSREEAKSIADNIYELVPELREAEYYYNNRVIEKMKELEPVFTALPEIKNEINRDFSELDSVYVSLKNDLKDNIANDKVLEAMIQNYRLKLEILEDVLSELKSDQNEKEINSDKYSS